MSIRIVDSFFIRRSIHGGYSNNKVDVLFIELCENNIIDPNDLYNKLISGSNKSVKWPTDEDISTRLNNEDLYNEDESNKIALMILHQLDMKVAGRWTDEGEKIQIEHVFPKTESDDWKKEFTPEEYQSMYNLRHRLGNLTLSDYNQVHAQKVYDIKRQEYQNLVSYRITRYLADAYDHWDSSVIMERNEDLIKDVLEAWPRDLKTLTTIPKRKQLPKKKKKSKDECES